MSEGFPQDAIDASVNSVEFSLREFNTGSFPRGLSFMLGAVNQWIYDRDPLDGLRFEKPLEELKVLPRPTRTHRRQLAGSCTD